MTQQAENRPTRRKETLHAFLYVALVAAGVFAAWQIHVWQQGRQQAGVNPATRAAQAESSPADVDIRGVLSGKGPIELGGLHEVKTDPGGIAPPAGAKRLHSYARTAMGITEQVAGYESASDIPAVAEHYVQETERAGYRLLKDQTREGRRSLVFSAGDRSVTVMLEKKMPSGEVVSIVLVVTCPAGPATSAPASVGK